jgi:hypothetical protein
MNIDAMRAALVLRSSRGNYLEQFDTDESIINAFQAEPNALDGAAVLVAWYGLGDYEGSAFVLFLKDDTLYEVNGAHCSCYGLENQWEPEVTSTAALRKREWYSSCEGHEDMQARLMEVLDILDNHIIGESHADRIK